MNQSVFVTDDYHLMKPLPKKVWHHAPYTRGVMYCRNCLNKRFHVNTCKTLKHIGIGNKMMPAYLEHWVCEMCGTSDW